MATAISLRPSFPPVHRPSLRRNPRSFSVRLSQFVCPDPVLLKCGRGNFPTQKRLVAKSKASPLTVVAAQFNFFKVVQTALRVGKDGIDAGTNLVPDSVPRPIARIGVAVLAVTVSFFILKSFLSTAFFVLGMMGFIYFIFLAMNKDNGPGGDGGSTSSTEESLEEARRIMEKYK